MNSFLWKKLKYFARKALTSCDITIVYIKSRPYYGYMTMVQHIEDFGIGFLSHKEQARVFSCAHDIPPFHNSSENYPAKNIHTICDPEHLYIIGQCIGKGRCTHLTPLVFFAFLRDQQAFFYLISYNIFQVLLIFL